MSLSVVSILSNNVRMSDVGVMWIAHIFSNNMRMSFHRSIVSSVIIHVGTSVSTNV